MLKVGITGGIGSGKSIVSNFFSNWGAYIFDADKQAKNILLKNETAQSEIISEFGSDVINANNKIDKKKLSRVAFQDEDNQLKLNTIIHPYVFQEIDKQFEKILNTGKHDIFVIDAALIYESGADTHMDYVILICSKIGLRTERVLERGKIDRDQFLQRVNLQWSDKDKIQLADFVIYNNDTKEKLEQQAKTIFNNLI
ncbi:MAG: dephospho-CoA kinase [Candidatus Marinimicrobia bacterium]|nr:dephospho-CoA kinase [Candidatus Neomarinimicrobiota bacterium]|tara:strand:- start:265 stop:858 length:594 start_codon:yes stop_codon:yes gene_type:complete